MIMKKHKKPENPFEDLTKAELRKESAKRLASLIELEKFSRDEKTFSRTEPTRRRLESERRQIEATLKNLTKDK